MASLSPTTFGDLLKQLRKRAGLTQRELAAAVGYSLSFISNLELNQRLPDVGVIVQSFIPALGLQDEPRIAAALIEQAALARGEPPPTVIAYQRITQTVVQEERLAHSPFLPALPTQVLGRAAEITQLCNRLLGHQGRLLTLVGPPGIGKTTLALAVAERLQPHYRDGVVFVPLAAVNEATVMAAAILAAVGGSDASGKPPQTQLIAFLRRKSPLVVLDNLEQITDAATLIADLLAECPGLVLLATSRERLHLRAEQRYKVLPLALPAAVALFVQRAQAVNHEFSLTAQNGPTLEAICERLDRLPLALELCAAQIELFAPAQLLAQLQARPLDLLVDGGYDLPPQHRTLRAAIDRSYQRLPAEEQRLLRSLGVFVGSFALSEVEQVSQSQPAPPTRPLPALLHALIHKSLVRSETTATGEQRFLLLETIREYALEQVHVHGEETALRARHYAAYLQLFRMGDSYLRGPEATTWFARLEPDQDNLRAALQWTLDTARYVDMTWLLQSVRYFWALNGHRYETARWTARLLPHRQILAVELRLPLLTEFVVSAGGSGEFPALEQYRDEIIRLMEVCPYKEIQAVAWHFLAQSHEEKARAIALAREANEAPTLGPEFGGLTDTDFALAAIQAGYAGSLLHQGEVVEATALVRDSLHRFRRRGNQEFIAECLGILAEFAFLRGATAEAYAYVQEAMTIGKTHNLRIVQAEWQWLLGRITLYRGDAAEARRLFEEVLPLCLDIKNTFYLAQVCIGLAETALWEEDLEQAAHWLGQSLAYHSAPQRITAAELQQIWVAARLATAQGEYRRAATLFGLAEAVHCQIHHIYQGPMLSLVDAALVTVRAALESVVFAEAFAAGQQMSLEEAFVTLRAPTQVTRGLVGPAPNW